MAVTIDRIEGAGGKKDKDGYELTRVAYVDGMSGNAAQRMIEAIDAVIVVTGDVGASHPDRTRAKLKSFTPGPEKGDTATVTITYKDQISSVGETDEAVIRVGTSLSQQETNQDVDGNLITLTYNYPADYKLNPANAGKEVIQGGLVSKRVPGTQLVITMTENTTPLTKSQLFVGTVNALGWSFDPLAPPRTWLCTGIEGLSNDNGVTFETNYSFEFRLDTWDETVYFINPDDGKPPADLEDSGNSGILTVELYVEDDFDQIYDVTP